MENGHCLTGGHCPADPGTAGPERVSCVEVFGENVPANGQRAQKPHNESLLGKSRPVWLSGGAQREQEGQAVSIYPGAIF